jgi:hypothetical protein
MIVLVQRAEDVERDTVYLLFRFWRWSNRHPAEYGDCCCARWQTIDALM